jgi:hypothetical protein
MVIRDQLRNVARKIVESKPSEQTLRRSVQSRVARTIMFTDDGIVPNHPRWPLIVYRGAVLTHGIKQPEVLIDALFAANEWGRSWRDTIYDFVHYHSQIHEVLGVARKRVWGLAFRLKSRVNNRRISPNSSLMQIKNKHGCRSTIERCARWTG